MKIKNNQSQFARDVVAVMVTEESSKNCEKIKKIIKEKNKMLDCKSPECNQE